MDALLKPPRPHVMGTLLSSLILAIGSAAMLAATWFLGVYREKTADIETIPPFAKAVVIADEHHALWFLAAILMAPALWLLIAGKKRLRANLCAGLLGMTLGFTALVLFFAALLPLIRIAASFSDN